MTFELRYPTRAIANAESRRSDLGGAVMPPEVIEAMVSAGTHHVDMSEMLTNAGRELAEMTRNPGALVVPGAAAGLALATLAAMLRGRAQDAWSIESLRAEKSLPDRLVVQASHMSPYGHACRLVGARLRVIGDRDETTADELASALERGAAAVLFVPGRSLPDETLDLATVVDIAAQHDVPVIVDAAAQLPPVDNLWHFTVNEGADLAVFSGGKDLEGPAPSGLLLGEPRLLDCVRELTYPNHHLARAFKVGKEEVAGLVAAVRRYVSMDHDARLRRLEDVCARWLEEFSALPGVVAARQFPNEAGQALPRVSLTLDPEVLAVDALAIRERLRQADPAVAVSADGQNRLYLTPEPLSADEVGLVIEAVKQQLLSVRRPAAGR